ncbi:MAG: hypothetical protein JXR76_18180 [Deltaproteobacteria bacterium]|nr:hypothetical protein [Deltaproteobacteria bacterium]
MSSLNSVEKRVFEELFDLGSGHVLNYSNKTYAEFFRECVGIDIYNHKYAFNGDSKGKRFRAFWELESAPVVGKVLSELLDLWSCENPTPDTQDKLRYDKARSIAARLQGITSGSEPESTEDDFIKQQFKNIDVGQIGLESNLEPIVRNRLNEARHCLKADAPLSVIFLCGSVLEGILLSVANQEPKTFNTSKSTPKDKHGNVKRLPDWSLAELINVAYETGFIKLDVKKFSHALRDFRNYIHPFQQAMTGFNPDTHTAQICLQVLRAAIAQLIEKRRRF